MTLETITKIFSDLFSTGWVGPQLNVAWHAGEPLVLPVEYYAAAFRVIADLAPGSTKVQHIFQTNGMLIDDEWCRFFNANNAHVGVSVDGPEDVHDANRRTRSGRATFQQTIAGIRCLRRHEVDFVVITVLSRGALGRAREFYDFYRNEGITSVCFNGEEIEGSHRDSSLANHEAEYEEFLRDFWNINVASNNILYIREFNDTLEKIITRPDGTNSLVEPFCHLNVDWQGNYSTFSPEFLGHKNQYYNDFIIGNFHKNRLVECVESEAFKRLSSDVAEGVELCRKSCEYFPICGGGSPANKLYENGTVISSETMFCRLSVQVSSDIAMEIIENSAAALT